MRWYSYEEIDVEDMEAMHADGDEEDIENEAADMGEGGSGQDESGDSEKGMESNDDDHDDEATAAAVEGVLQSHHHENSHVVLAAERHVVNEVSAELAGVRVEDTDLLLEDSSLVATSNNGDEEDIEDEWEDAVEGESGAT